MNRDNIVMRCCWPSCTKRYHQYFSIHIVAHIRNDFNMPVVQKSFDNRSAAGSQKSSVISCALIFHKIDIFHALKAANMNIWACHETLSTSSGHDLHLSQPLSGLCRNLKPRWGEVYTSKLARCVAFDASLHMQRSDDITVETWIETAVPTVISWDFHPFPPCSVTNL